MGAPKSTIQQKVDWLCAHPELWRNWPSGNDDWIKNRMRADGLISEHANNYDIMDFGKLIGLAREQMRKDRRHEDARKA